MIAIIDYDIGNLGSVKNALDFLKIESVITSDKNVILSADKVILPGVGAFKDAIDTFRRLKLDEVLFECNKQNKPILGICVGMQMLFEASHEHGYHEGLGLLKGEFVRFNEGLGTKKFKIPHMGWNKLNPTNNESKLLNKAINEYVYFVHSYYLVNDDKRYSIAKCYYADTEFTCAIRKDNIYAVQFHPEKSGDIGLQILKNFGEL